MKFKEAFKPDKQYRDMWDNPNWEVVAKSSQLKKQYYTTNPHIDKVSNKMYLDVKDIALILHNPHLNAVIRQKLTNSLLGMDLDAGEIKLVLQSKHLTPEVREEFKSKLPDLDKNIGKLAKFLEESGFTDTIDVSMEENIVSSYVVREPVSGLTLKFIAVDDEPEVYVYKTFNFKEDVWEYVVENDRVQHHLEIKIPKKDYNLFSDRHDVEETDEEPEVKDVEGQQYFDFADEDIRQKNRDKEYSKERYESFVESIKNNRLAWVLDNIDSYSSYVSEGSYYKLSDNEDLEYLMGQIKRAV